MDRISIIIARRSSLELKACLGVKRPKSGKAIIDGRPAVRLMEFGAIGPASFPVAKKHSPVWRKIKEVRRFPVKALAFSIAFLFCTTCLAQTKTAPPLKTTKAQLAQAQADLQASELARVELESKNKALEGRNKELEASNAELNGKMDEIKKAAELLKADAVVYPAASKLQSDYAILVQKYNSLLEVAQNLDGQLRAANSRQQQFNNALALYNSMPKYSPPQQIQVTNCNALPALCVH